MNWNDTVKNDGMKNWYQCNVSAIEAWIVEPL
jgi:hypothetical protein